MLVRSTTVHEVREREREKNKEIAASCERVKLLRV